MTGPEAIVLAQEMRAAGWKVVEIRDYLASHGITATRTTVGRWSDPEVWDRQRAANNKVNQVRRARRNNGRLGRHDLSPVFKRQRVLALRGAGLSVEGVVKVIRLDFRDPITRHTVVKVLNGGDYPNFKGQKCPR